MLIRSMNPKVVVADEIGSKEDIEAIKQANCSGVKGIFTAHGSGVEDIIKSPIIGELYKLKFIERIIVIDENKKGYLEYKK